MTFKEFKIAIKGAKTGDRVECDDHEEHMRVYSLPFTKMKRELDAHEYSYADSDLSQCKLARLALENIRMKGVVGSLYPRHWRDVMTMFAARNLNLKNNSMNTVQRIKNATKKEPEKTLFKTGIIDENDELTRDGRELMWSILFEEHKDKMREQVKPLLDKE